MNKFRRKTGKRDESCFSGWLSMTVHSWKYSERVEKYDMNPLSHSPHEHLNNCLLSSPPTRTLHDNHSFLWFGNNRNHSVRTQCRVLFNLELNFISTNTFLLLDRLPILSFCPQTILASVHPCSFVNERKSDRRTGDSKHD